jgi:hypothetical protein
MKIALGILVLAAIAFVVARLAARPKTTKESAETEYRKGVDTGCLG